MSPPGTETLAQALDRRTREGELWESLQDEKLRCFACGHRCLILPGHQGICRIRRNEGGSLRVPFDYVAGAAVDPIEKKPFFHVLPGARAFSFGMLGCDYHCTYCQNWLTSQTLREPAAVSPIREVSASELAGHAARSGAEVITSTYNEPLITSEWAVAVFREARRHGMVTGYVSNGNGTGEVLDYLRPHLDLYKVDLKGFRDRAYRDLGGVLQAVLDTIQGLVRRQFWLEVVTLVVPGLNDSEQELRDIASFLAGLSRDIPWHVTAFHPDYKMKDRGGTPAETLLRACEIGREEGLSFVYAGNLPGRVTHWEQTRCPACDNLLVHRVGYMVRVEGMSEDGRCASCGEVIPGFWAGGQVGPRQKSG
jgi:pyruvate formate lyase activating enzyme